MSKRVISMATLLYAADHETTFKQAEIQLMYPKASERYMRIARLALEHIPYLPPEEPGPCVTCGQVSNPCDKKPGPPGYAEGFDDAKELVAGFLDCIILSPGQKAALSAFVRSLTPDTERKG